MFLVVMRRDKTLGKMTHKEGPHSWSLFCDSSCDIYEHQDGRREGRRKVKTGEGGWKKDRVSSSSSPSVNKKLPMP
jgi:hypothetical protein